MRLFVLMPLAAALLGGSSLASAEEAPAASAPCVQAIHRVATDPAGVVLRREQGNAVLLRAVDLRVNACSVLVAADTGRLYKPPVFANGPEKVMPAR